MKKFVLVISSMLVLSASAFAQDVFYPGFYAGIKGGASYTVGETAGLFDTKLISPAAALDLGYQVSPVFGVRANIAGWQGKGGFVDDTVYGFNYAQAAVDATFDICNLFGYKQRVLNPYAFIGVGALGLLKNGADVSHTDINLYWEPVKLSTMAHAGAGIDIRLSDLLAIELEYAYNAMPDCFNSKAGSYLDHQHVALAGLKFNFGAADGKKKAAEAAAAAAAAAAAQAAAAQARADKELADAIAAANEAIANAQKAIAENDFIPEDDAAINDAIQALKKAIAAKDVPAILAGTKALNDAVAAARTNLADKIAADQKAAAEKAAAEKLAWEQARLQALADAKQAAKLAINNVFYVIGKYDIRNVEHYKIKKAIKKLKADPDARIVLCGFADKYTGEPDTNWVLSENRCKGVKDWMVEAGIDPSRIDVFWFGDTEEVSRIPEKNRTTVMILK